MNKLLDLDSFDDIFNALIIALMIVPTGIIVQDELESSLFVQIFGDRLFRLI